MTDWNCPQDLKIGESIWVKLRTSTLVVGRMRVDDIKPGTHGPWAKCNSRGSTFYLPLTVSGNLYEWKRESVETLPCFEAAAPSTATYGATCTKCNMLNEYTESRSNYVCYGCRV